VKRFGAMMLMVGLAGCDLDASDFASFLGGEFGEVSGKATSLDAEGVTRVMDVAIGRFRTWNRLREALPFSLIAESPCSTEGPGQGGVLTITTDIACAVGPGASGVTTLTQEQLASQPAVFRFAITYADVVMPALAVTGAESLTETIDPNGATLHDVDVVQDGVTWRYTFRSGLLDGEVPVFDYVVPSVDGQVTVRLTNPARVGEFATVFVTGSDGVLNCALRDSDWDLPPRGTCDNGVVFGLP
jgi:hypothetical protein